MILKLINSEKVFLEFCNESLYLFAVRPYFGDGMAQCTAPWTEDLMVGLLSPAVTRGLSNLSSSER